MQTPEILSIGLRFKRTDAPILRRLERAVRNGELVGDVTTYEQAALAAETGEPLVVLCNSAREALAMAAGYVANGTSQPAIEPLSR